MQLITGFNNEFDIKIFINQINEFSIKKVVFIQENDQKADIEIKRTIEMIKSFNLDYYWIKVDQFSSNFSILAILSKIVMNYKEYSIINLNYFNTKYLVLLTQLTGILYPRINFTYITDVNYPKNQIKMPIVQVNLDPDKETNILKIILSIFTYKSEYYTFLNGSIERSSPMILSEINSILAKKNISRSYPYIQACLNTLSSEGAGRETLLKKRQNSGKKRELIYSLTEFGLFSLYSWYLKEANSSKGSHSYLFRKLDSEFKNIEFSEIVFESFSEKNICNQCTKEIESELLKCSFCRMESCKPCLNTHYLENKCIKEPEKAFS